MVGLAAQLAAHKERISEPSTSNQIKIEMARYVVPYTPSIKCYLQVADW